MSDLSDMERGDLEESYSLCAVALANREAENAELRRQRDALLAACRAALGTWEKFDAQPVKGSCDGRSALRAAIAKAEEATP